MKYEIFRCTVWGQNKTEQLICGQFLYDICEWLKTKESLEKEVEPKDFPRIRQIEKHNTIRALHMENWPKIKTKQNLKI